MRKEKTSGVMIFFVVATKLRLIDLIYRSLTILYQNIYSYKDVRKYVQMLFRVIKARHRKLHSNNYREPSKFLY